ncbi:MAG: hypothetical protein AAFQ65_08780 [Myxococcota bacterium]
MTLDRSPFALSISFFCIVGACSDDSENPADPGQDGPTILVPDRTLNANVTEDTTLSGFVRISGLLTVSAALVIEPGTWVQFERDSGLRMETGGGSLTCNGTEDEPVSISGIFSRRGSWEALVFASNESANTMMHCIISGGGAGSNLGFSGNDTASVIVEGGARLSIFRSSIGNSRGDGIVFRENAIIGGFGLNIFDDNGGSPVRISANNTGVLDVRTSYGTNNGDDFIEVTGTRVTDGQTWAVTPIPYKILERLVLQLRSTDALVVGPGVTLLMAENAGIRVESGALALRGATPARITVRGAFETPGYWDMISFASNSPGNVIQGAEIAHGGAASDFDFTGDVESSIRVEDGGLVRIEDSIIRDTEDAGITLEEGANLLSFMRNTFNNNGGPGLRVYPRHLVQLDEESVYGGVSGQENADPWIDVTSSSPNATALTVDGSGTWVATDVPYRFEKRADIQSSAAIDVDAGVTLWLAPQSGISVQGLLRLRGTADEQIEINRESDTAGNWDALVFEGSSQSSIDHTVIQHGGTSSDFGFSGDEDAMIIVREDALLGITNSAIRDSTEIGIFVRDDAVLRPDPITSEGNTFSGNTTNFLDGRL